MVPDTQEVEAGGLQWALELKTSLGCRNGTQPENKQTFKLGCGLVVVSLASTGVGLDSVFSRLQNQTTGQRKQTLFLLYHKLHILDRKSWGLPLNSWFYWKGIIFMKEMKSLEVDSMSTAQSLSYLVSSHHGSGTSLLSFHSHPRRRPLDRQWVVMPLLSLLLTDSAYLSLKSDLLQTSSFCSSWEQCVTTCGEVGRCWVTCFLCAWATCLSLLVWVFCSVVLRIEPMIANMLGECSTAELHGPALYCVIWYGKPLFSPGWSSHSFLFP